MKRKPWKEIYQNPVFVRTKGMTTLYRSLPFDIVSRDVYWIAYKRFIRNERFIPNNVQRQIREGIRDDT